MRVQRGHRYAVLTGDVVGSGELDSATRRRLPRVIARCGEAVAKEFAEAGPVGPDQYRGDGWQLLLRRPAAALRVAVHFRATLRVLLDSAAADTRVSIGVGEIDFLPGDRVAQGDGDAYRRSGQGLDALDRRVRMCLRPDDTPLAVALDALVVTTDALVTDWTPSQARAACGASTGRTQQRIGKRWKPQPISQQAVAQHLDRARWYAVDFAMAAFERALQAGQA